MPTPTEYDESARRRLGARAFDAALAELTAAREAVRSAGGPPEEVARLTNLTALWSGLRPAWTARGEAPEPVSRRLTVRYFREPRPGRRYPVLVALSALPLQSGEMDGTATQTEAALGVGYGEAVEVRAVLPGCTCTPQRLLLTPRAEPVSGRFEVVCSTAEAVADARLVVAQSGRVLAEVPLVLRPRHGRARRAAVAVAGLLPAVLKSLDLNVDRLAHGSAAPVKAVLTTGGWALGAPWWALLAAGIALAAGIGWALRPRPTTFGVVAQVPPAGPDEQFELVREALAAGDERTALALAADLFLSHPEYPRGWLAVGEWLYDRGREAEALPYLTRALDLAPIPAPVLGKAARAAARAGQTELAVAWLERGAAGAEPGVRWKLFFNLACYRTRLGRPDAAVDAAREAVRDPRLVAPGAFEADPDLAPLRARTDFRQLLALLPRSS